MTGYRKVFRCKKKSQIQFAQSNQCHFIPCKNKLSLADVAKRFSEPEHCLLLFSKLEKALIIEQIHEALVEKCRTAKARQEEPTVGIIDAQPVKNTLVSSRLKGFDAGKKVKGSKRNIIVEALGSMLPVVIKVLLYRIETERWK